MGLVLGGKQPETIREFVATVMEALLTIWFAKFNLDMHKLPIVMVEAMQENEELLGGEIAMSETTFPDPLALALHLSGDRCYAQSLYDGTPVTVEKLGVVISKLLAAGVHSQFKAEVMKACLGDIMKNQSS